VPDSTISGKEAQLRCLVDVNIVGVMISTTDRVVDANDHYLQMIGYTRADLVDGLVPWQEMTPPEWRATTETAAAEVRERGAWTPYEKELRRKDGTRVPVLVRSAILEQEPRTFISSVLDLTETKRLEAALRRAQDEAERSHEAVRSFVSTMRHDLRSPLNVVLGFGQLLQLDDLDANQREAVEQILDAANQLLTLINETVDVSRIEGKVKSR
jgi:PAS domain S-box-containing protein